MTTQESKTLTAIVIPADPDESIMVLELEKPNYKTYQRLVRGLIQFIDLTHDGTICCNDEAKLLGLPPNIRATSLLYLTRPEFIGADFIAGDVVVLGQPDDDGDTTGAPDLYKQLLDPSVRIEHRAELRKHYLMTRRWLQPENVWTWECSCKTAGGTEAGYQAGAVECHRKFAAHLEDVKARLR